MEKSIFKITKMDCPSEENLIRLKLQDISIIQDLDFDISNRKLTIYHLAGIKEIEASLSELKLGDKLLSTESSNYVKQAKNNNQKKLLWAVLVINFAFFIIEMTTGLISKSMGLVADSLDMLADSFVYGISLLAVGGSVVRKKGIAKLSGYLQIILAIIGFVEVLRRVIGAEDVPDFKTMIVVSIFALMANGACLYLLQLSKSKKDAHMQASIIFTSNDVIINVGVIVAALFVNWTNTNLPDLIIGSIVFIIVLRGAYRILKLSK
jgi:Co/Zn/Cd efflux system component